MRLVLILGILFLIAITVTIIILLVHKHASSPSCQANCTNKACGDDGCGGSCGYCPSPQSCQNGQCIGCIPQCASGKCGSDGCGGVCSCPNNYTCQNGNCVSNCSSPCGNKNCGFDGCGNSCGSCPPPQICQNGICGCPPSQPNCLCKSNCNGKQCGDDGCGGNCGTCASGECVNGVCQQITQSCPYPGSSPNPPPSLPSGQYSISYDGSPVMFIPTYGSTVSLPLFIHSVGCNDGDATIWTYDADKQSVSVNIQVPGLNQTLYFDAYDSCWGTGCGSPYGSTKPNPPSLPSGAVCAGSQPQHPHFILGKNGTIYSVDAQAYIVPDIRPCGDTCWVGICQHGPNCNYQAITYTTNAQQASVWTIQ